MKKNCNYRGITMSAQNDKQSYYPTTVHINTYKNSTQCKKTENFKITIFIDILDPVKDNFW